MKTIKSIIIKKASNQLWVQAIILLSVMLTIMTACSPVAIPASPLQPTTLPLTGIVYTIKTSNQCQTFLFSENADATFGPCDGSMQTTPFVETIRTEELAHYISTFRPFQIDTPDGFLEFVGVGNLQASIDEQRSIVAWVQLVVNETQAGRSSASDDLVIGWHQEGGLGGFCGDLLIYATGSVSAISCKNGQVQSLGQTWLDAKQLSLLHQWMDNLMRFEYAPQTTATTDSLTIHLVFAGNGSTSPAENDQQAISAFSESIYSQLNNTFLREQNGSN